MQTIAPPRRPWRNSRGSCRWFPDRMVRVGFLGRHPGGNGRMVAEGNDRICVRKVRVKQRRLDRFLADPHNGEWE
ncbi:hypothetical protein [Methylobacterium variabile]|uniref:hypothetical protein n=1 Tax=Methylobacterium variabile TaxID=298794 RepID=UPI0012ED5C77|nr:hypothetical protein [Methylobacterium variabile]